MNHPRTICDMTIQDRKIAVKILEDAFVRDPLFISMNEDSLIVRKIIHHVAKLMFDTAIIKGFYLRGLFAADEIKGCYIMEANTPNHNQPTFKQFQLLKIFWEFLTALPLRYAQQMNDYYVKTRNHLEHQHYYYLTMIGVNPIEQGHGFGSGLIKDAIMISKKDTYSNGIYLDTENPANVDFYKKFGFEVKSIFNFKNFSAYRMFHSTKPHE